MRQVGAKSSAKEKAALFERLARKKEARLAAVHAAPPMAGRIDMQEVQGKLHHSDPVERVLPITPTVFDNMLPPQVQRPRPPPPLPRPPPHWPPTTLSAPMPSVRHPAPTRELMMGSTD